MFHPNTSRSAHTNGHCPVLLPRKSREGVPDNARSYVLIATDCDGPSQSVAISTYERALSGTPSRDFLGRSTGQCPFVCADRDVLGWNIAAFSARSLHSLGPLRHPP